MSVRFETLPADKRRTRVWLNSQLVGEVRRVEGGFRYVPRGQPENRGGRIFTSESSCRRSVTGGDEE